ncbi:hypothetical protein PF007_g3731 [Phytophthora fragariae]|nr:hypothetical protein PF003_g11830 [Phytophthora fragariae]KAE8943832.1 hypothetical protein PF009_g6463 [Phytophthora fragariae]KAE9132411.1 hypothetical protein PF007_g3731 [Phytophthora fragariae]KAE9319965.1 hypothetical protein PF001_g5640 [Phytophthora fragariae]KAE9362170.1 hypothetical protein PF008_g280 [Phytophthora fragariae]
MATDPKERPRPLKLSRRSSRASGAWYMSAKHVPMSAVCSVTAPDPRNYSEAMHDTRADKGKVGMEEKIGALENNQP